MSNVVLWSGGPDSTLILHRLALQGPVRALTLEQYPFLDQCHAKAQEAAQLNYMCNYVELCSKNIRYESIRITGTAKVYADHKNELGEPLILLCYCMPSIKNGDTVYSGHFSPKFCKNINKFQEAWDIIMRLKGIDSRLEFPYITKNMNTTKIKANILKELDSLRIPEECYWSCSKPKYISETRIYISCNQCKKCNEIKQTRKLLKRDRRR